ncbi:MAG: extracellular solute-binding protein [Sneathiellaceae bacterium]
MTGPGCRPAALFCLLSLLLAALPAGAQDKTADAQVVNVFGWYDYVDPAVLADFTAETGIAVRYESYSNLPMLEATLRLGATGYDIVMPTNEPSLSSLIADGLLARIDHDRLANWKNLDPALMRRIEESDPGNLHGPIFLWGTLGLGIRHDKVRELAPDAPLDSFALLLDPEYAGRLQPCGITMLDSPDDVIPSVLQYLGLPPDSRDPLDLQAVERTLMQIRPYIRSFSYDSAPKSLADGSTCLAIYYSGDVLEAKAEAARNGIRVDYILPETGAQVTYDVLAIPADAPHKEAAYAFIDFMLRPEVMARLTNYSRFANAVPASHPMVEPALLHDTDIFPTEAQLDGFFTPEPLNIGAKMTRNRLWARFKDGRG